MEPMLIIIICYVIVGVIIFVTLGVLDWYQGEDITLTNLNAGKFILWAWPLVVALMVSDCVTGWCKSWWQRSGIKQRNGVLIPGRLSAKVERALRDPNGKPD